MGVKEHMIVKFLGNLVPWLQAIAFLLFSVLIRLTRFYLGDHISAETQIYIRVAKQRAVNKLSHAVALHL